MRFSPQHPGPNQLVIWTHYALIEDRTTYREPEKRLRSRTRRPPRIAPRRLRDTVSVAAEV